MDKLKIIIAMALCGSGILMTVLFTSTIYAEETGNLLRFALAMLIAGSYIAALVLAARAVRKNDELKRLIVLRGAFIAIVLSLLVFYFWDVVQVAGYELPELTGMLVTQVLLASVLVGLAIAKVRFL